MPIFNRDYEVASYWNKTTFLENVDGVISLQRTHSYYHQVISQMALTQSHNSYFDVWTKKRKPLIEKIQFNSKCWENVLSSQVIFLKHTCNLFWWELNKYLVAQSAQSHV